jgi:hypothetical protein
VLAVHKGCETCTALWACTSRRGWSIRISGYTTARRSWTAEEDDGDWAYYASKSTPLRAVSWLTDWLTCIFCVCARTRGK